MRRTTRGNDAGSAVTLQRKAMAAMAAMAAAGGISQQIWVRWDPHSKMENTETILKQRCFLNG